MKPAGASPSGGGEPEVLVFDGRSVQKFDPKRPNPPPAPRLRQLLSSPSELRETTDREKDEEIQKLFREMARDVEGLGATGLDKRSRRELDKRRLESLGMTAASRPRIPASVGKGMARKEEQRDEQARQDDYAVNGKLQKKKRKAPEGRRDRTADGVAWGSGGESKFRGGTLYLAKPEAKEELGGGGAGGKKRKGSGGKKGKGGGGKKGGKGGKGRK